jgi:hypothetical protein
VELGDGWAFLRRVSPWTIRVGMGETCHCVLEFPGGFAGHEVSVCAGGADLDGTRDALRSEVRTADRMGSVFGGVCTRSGDIVSKLACGGLAPASLRLGPWWLLPLEAMLKLNGVRFGGMD